MSRSLVERRLQDLSSRLRELREELRVVDEQLTQLVEEADEARLRALVSETPLAEHDHREVQRHADTMARHRDSVQEEIDKLERSQDDLLDRLLAKPS